MEGLRVTIQPRFDIAVGVIITILFPPDKIFSGVGRRDTGRVGLIALVSF
jgi:hypothetical protein